MEVDSGWVGGWVYGRIKKRYVSLSLNALGPISRRRNHPIPSTLPTPPTEDEEQTKTLVLPTVDKAAFESVLRFLRLLAANPMQDIPKVSQWACGWGGWVGGWVGDGRRKRGRSSSLCVC